MADMTGHIIRKDMDVIQHETCYKYRQKTTTGHQVNSKKIIFDPMGK
jgi:hypothetical protein